MVLDLLKQLVPYGLIFIIGFFLFLALKNRKRLRKLRHTGRLSEIIDRRRNVIVYLTLSALIAVGLIIYCFS